MKKYLIIICVALLAAVGTLASMLATEKTENKRLAKNQEALLAECTEYQSESERNAMSTMELQLKYDELTEYYNDIVGKAADLKLQVKRLQSASDTGTKTDVNIQTALKDSIIYRDRILTDTLYKYIYTIKAFNWSDPWITCNGSIYNDSIQMNIASTDTITQFVHRIPKKWWFFRWGTKAIKQDIVCSNPHTKLTYTKYIELKK